MHYSNTLKKKEQSDIIASSVQVVFIRKKKQVCQICKHAHSNKDAITCENITFDIFRIIWKRERTTC
jgi:hypothetical protein